MRSTASRPKKCAGAVAAAVIAAGAAGAGAAGAGAGAAAVGVAGIGAGVVAVVGAAATGVVVVTTGKSPPGIVQSVFQRSGDRFASRKRVKSKIESLFRFHRNGLSRNKKSPARAGFLSCFGNVSKRGSVHTATRCRKGTRDRAAPRRRELRAAPRRPGPDEPQRPGDWAGNHHRDRDANQDRIRPRLPPR
jgi:hypothetical protein